MLRVSVVLLSVLCVVYAAASSGGDLKSEKLSKEQGCYIEESDQFIPFGQSAPSRIGCKEYTCYEGNEIVAKTCASVAALPPYVAFEDKTKPYPGCCPYFEIPKKNNPK